MPGKQQDASKDGINFFRNVKAIEEEDEASE